MGNVCKLGSEKVSILTLEMKRLQFIMNFSKKKQRDELFYCESVFNAVVIAPLSISSSSLLAFKSSFKIGPDSRHKK